MKPNDELQTLLTRLSDDTMSEADAVRLNELLHGNPEACERYLNHMTLEAHLERELGGATEVDLPGVQAPQTHSQGARHKLIAFPMWLRLAAVLAVCATWLAMRENFTNEAGTASENWLATVLLAEDCEWRHTRGISEGGRLPAQRLHLLRGTAILRLDGGAEIMIRGATELELQSATQARLRSGDVVVRAEGDAAGFKLLTPSRELTDLGTEFAVKVERGGATELHVLEGEVAYASSNSMPTGEVANAGQAVRFENAQATPKPVKLDAPRFGELVKKAAPRERPDLMTVYDGFLYDEGTYQPGELTGGKGWAGPWRLRERGEWQGANRTDTTTDMRIVHGKLSVPWPVDGGRLGMLEMPPGQFYRVRQMAKPIAMDRDGITYFSLMTQEPNHSVRGLAARTQEGVRLTFRSSANYSGESLSFGIGKELRPHINALPSGVFESLARVPDEQSLLWIGKVIHRADGEDEITFRIYGQNDPLDYAEPPTWHVATRGVRQNAALDLVVISSTGTATRIVDELRIGPTWRSVVPIKKTEISDAR